MAHMTQGSGMDLQSPLGSWDPMVFCIFWCKGLLDAPRGVVFELSMLGAKKMKVSDLSWCFKVDIQ